MAGIQLAFQRDPSTGQISFGANGYPLFEANVGANTYGSLQARVQDEVLGSSTTSQIQNAIQDAIASYERESFWFNQIRYYSALTTVSGQEFYSYDDWPPLNAMPHISKVLILAFANRYPLNERTLQWIDDQSISTTWQGLPTDWCFQSGALRLYPVPNGGYPIILDGTIRFAPLVNSTDFNCWTNEAEALIRTEAKRLLFTNISRDAEQAAAMQSELMGDPSMGRQGVLAMLRRETTRRAGGTGKIRPSRGYI